MSNYTPYDEKILKNSWVPARNTMESLLCSIYTFQLRFTAVTLLKVREETFHFHKARNKGTKPRGRCGGREI